MVLLSASLIAVSCCGAARAGCCLELRLEDLFSGPPEQTGALQAQSNTNSPLSFRHFTLDMLQVPALLLLAACADRADYALAVAAGVSIAPHAPHMPSVAPCGTHS